MRPSTYKAAIYRGIGSSDVSAYRHGGDANMIWKDHKFGREAISELVEIGKHVKELAIRDRVFVNQGKALRDMRRMVTVGGFSKYIRIPDCEVGYSVLKIGNDIPLQSAVLVEPFVIGTRAAKNLKPGPDKTAVVFGAGIIGMSAAIMLRCLGCPKEMVVDISGLDSRMHTTSDSLPVIPPALQRQLIHRCHRLKRGN